MITRRHARAQFRSNAAFIPFPFVCRSPWRSLSPGQFRVCMRVGPIGAVLIQQGLFAKNNCPNTKNLLWLRMYVFVHGSVRFQSHMAHIKLTHSLHKAEELCIQNMILRDLGFLMPFVRKSHKREKELEHMISIYPKGLKAIRHSLFHDAQEKLTTPKHRSY